MKTFERQVSTSIRSNIAYSAIGSMAPTADSEGYHAAANTNDSYTKGSCLLGNTQTANDRRPLDRAQAHPAATGCLRLRM